MWIKWEERARKMAEFCCGSKSGRLRLESYKSKLAQKRRNEALSVFENPSVLDKHFGGNVIFYYLEFH